VGICAAEATQAVGALLLLGLIAGPAGAAQRITNRPYLAFGLSAAIAIACVWGGIIVSYLLADVPPTFAIVALVTACYLASFAISAIRSRTPTTSSVPDRPPEAATRHSYGSFRRRPTTQSEVE
jgi:zinc/manganese transport system permease protein